MLRDRWPAYRKTSRQLSNRQRSTAKPFQQSAPRYIAEGIELSLLVSVHLP